MTKSASRSPERHEPRRPKRVIRRHRLPDFLGCSRSTIDRWVKEGRLTPYLTGPRTVVFDEDEVLALQDAAKAKREQEDA
jgi:excisionase family DNA binding protein